MDNSGANCIIVGGGDFDGSLLPPRLSGNLLIAADSGYLHLNGAGIVPDLCVGDFDSLGFFPSDCEILRLPVEKDDTDLVAATRVGLKRGYRRFVYLGALGGARFSHSIAAVQTLSWLLVENARGIILSPGCRVSAVGRGSVRWDAAAHGSLSVFALGGDACVTLRGMHYPLDNYTLQSSFPLGVSNSFTGVPAEVTVHSGSVLLIEEP